LAAKMNWHAMTKVQILQLIKTSTDGLSPKDAKERLTTYGLNEIRESRKISKAFLLARSFKKLFILMLMAATII
jgi:magnesium-transporting ATPase (P-type)